MIRLPALALVFTCMPQLALAMAPQDSTLDEVQVTARRLPETARDVPLAIDVFTADTMRATGIQGLGGIAAIAPGLSFESQFGANGGAMTLRGQSQPTANADNVAVFVDGVYQASRSAIDVELLDIERVELVRGPQSTLFGHSAFAGALQIVSRAPTRELSHGAALDVGTDGWLGAQGFVSGPFGATGWLGRIAASYRGADGTINDVSSGQSLGDFSRKALVATIGRDSVESREWTASLSIRHTAGTAGHPVVSTLEGGDFNCGSRDPMSGLWSYYCGRAPVARAFDLSDDLPDSTSEVTQVALRIAVPLGRLRLESDTNGYSAQAHWIRDFDVSETGQTFGVCAAATSCLGSSTQTALVDRMMDINQVLAQQPAAEEFLQELRLRSEGNEAFSWLVGIVYFETREQTQTDIGASRGSLAAGERLVALLPGSPQFVGPISRINRALVDDPSEARITQILNHDHRRTLAAYAVADWKPNAALGLRAELRGTREDLKTDSVLANFLPSFGTSIPAQKFQDFTPRFSIDYAWNEQLRTYLSAAKGSRSGGINPIPGLVAEEQTFAPEYNWTYEAGLKLDTHGVLRSLRATAYYIDWKDTQISGFSNTPGITNLVTLNTAGLNTSGIETSMALQPAPWLRGEFDFSFVNPRFRRGSEDPGSATFCGLSPSSSASTFCDMGPPRNPTPNSPALVPWLDGNVPGRVPQTSWHGALIFTPQPLANDWRLQLRADFSHADEMYDRAIDALSFGERTLFDLRLSAARDVWSIELWGRNLTADRYIRSATSRQAQFFPTSPRPLDLIHEQGRRVGITIRYTN